MPKPLKNLDGSWTIHVRMHSGWLESDFTAKAEYLQEMGDRGRLTKKSGDVKARSGVQDTWRRAKEREREIFYSAESQQELDGLIRELDSQQIDHAQDLQLDGRDVLSNMWGIDAATNHGMGGQIKSQLSKIPGGGMTIRVRILS